VKVISVVGARPQFIKAAPVSAALRRDHTEILVHTGQHYGDQMSAIFFRELDMPEPDVNLGVGSGPHGWQTGQMLEKIEAVLLREEPDWVLVYGDTNSTLAGALAAVKLQIPVAHVEAGLRSFNWQMPEEHNRVLADHCSRLLFCPTLTAVDNLAAEGITSGVELVGDVMVDAIKRFAGRAARESSILSRLDLQPRDYLLATLHRPYTVDDPQRLSSVLAAFGEAEETIVFPAHPRTSERMLTFALEVPENVRLIEPVGYLDMLSLEQNARLILTDSGGIQKEAYVFGVPCITLRPETEWVETVASGWNRLADVDKEQILGAVRANDWPQGCPPPVYGHGDTAERIVWSLASAS
jgi:UDP-GlcNAc3NAcA epimerase